MTDLPVPDRIEGAYRSLLAEPGADGTHQFRLREQDGTINYLCLRSLDLLDLRGLGQAHTLLRLVCCLPGLPIPNNVLLAADFLNESELFWGLTTKRLEQLWTGLGRAELASFSTSGHGIPVVHIAPQVAAAMNADLQQSGQHYACVALWTTLLYYGTSEGIAGLPDDPACQPVWQLLVPLAATVFELAVTAHAAGGLPADHVDRAANAALHAADHLSAVGAHEEARQAAAAVGTGCRSVLGEYHHRTLLAQAFAASFAGRAGDVAAAAAGYESVLSVRLEHFGADHPDTVVARSNLAYWLGEDTD